MDRTIDPSPTQQRLIRRIDNRIHSQPCDVSLADFDARGQIHLRHLNMPSGISVVSTISPSPHA